MKKHTLFLLFSAAFCACVHGAEYYVPQKIKTSDDCLNKALSLAIETHQPEMVQFIIQSRRVDIYSRDNHSNELTMLDRAKENVMQYTKDWKIDEVITQDKKKTLDDQLKVVELLSKARAAQNSQMRKKYKETVRKFQNFLNITVDNQQTKEETVEVVYV